MEAEAGNGVPVVVEAVGVGVEVSPERPAGPAIALPDEVVPGFGLPRVPVALHHLREVEAVRTRDQDRAPSAHRLQPALRGQRTNRSE